MQKPLIPPQPDEQVNLKDLHPEMWRGAANDLLSESEQEGFVEKFGDNYCPLATESKIKELINALHQLMFDWGSDADAIFEDIAQKRVAFTRAKRRSDDYEQRRKTYADAMQNMNVLVRNRLKKLQQAMNKYSEANGIPHVWLTLKEDLSSDSIVSLGQSGVIPLSHEDLLGAADAEDLGKILFQAFVRAEQDSLVLRYLAEHDTPATGTSNVAELRQAYRDLTSLEFTPSELRRLTGAYQRATGKDDFRFYDDPTPEQELRFKDAVSSLYRERTGIDFDFESDLPRDDATELVEALRVAFLQRAYAGVKGGNASISSWRLTEIIDSWREGDDGSATRLSADYAQRARTLIEDYSKSRLTYESICASTNAPLNYIHMSLALLSSDLTNGTMTIVESLADLDKDGRITGDAFSLREHLFGPMIPDEIMSVLDKPNQPIPTYFADTLKSTLEERQFDLNNQRMEAFLDYRWAAHELEFRYAQSVMNKALLSCEVTASPTYRRLLGEHEPLADTNPEAAECKAQIEQMAEKVKSDEIKQLLLRNMEDFERRAQSSLMPADVLAHTYREIAVLLAADDAMIGKERRALLAAQIIQHGAHPYDLKQIQHSTCNVAPLAVAIFARDPGMAAAIVRAAITAPLQTRTEQMADGRLEIVREREVTLRDGSLVLVREADLKMDANPSRQQDAADRTYADRILQVVAVNAEQQTSASGDPESRYIFVPPESSSDTGERLINLRERRLAREKGKKYQPDESPTISGSALELTFEKLTGRSIQFYISHQNTNPRLAASAAGTFDSEESFRELLESLSPTETNPIIVLVNTQAEPFYRDSGSAKAGGSGEMHYVSVTGMETVDGRTDIYVDNQWGPTADHTKHSIKGPISVHDLYLASLPQNDAERFAILLEEAKLIPTRNLEYLRAAHSRYAVARAKLKEICGPSEEDEPTEVKILGFARQSEKYIVGPTAYIQGLKTFLDNVDQFSVETSQEVQGLVYARELAREAYLALADDSDEGKSQTPRSPVIEEDSVPSEGKIIFNGQEYSAAPGEKVTLGRTTERARETALSSKHATLVRNDRGETFITDNLSTHGTFVKHEGTDYFERIVPGVKFLLKPGDQVRLGGADGLPVYWEIPTPERWLQKAPLTYVKKRQKPGSDQESYMFTLTAPTGETQRAVFRATDNNPGTRDRARKERAAYKLNQIIGFSNGFPITVERIVKKSELLGSKTDRRGFIQILEGKDLSSAGLDWKTDAHLKEQLEQACLERLLYGNKDDGPSNFVAVEVDGQTRIRNIRMQFSFPREVQLSWGDGSAKDVTSEVHKEFEGKPLSPNCLKLVINFVQLAETEDGRDRVQVCGLSDPEIDALIARARGFLETKSFPTIERDGGSVLDQRKKMHQNETFRQPKEQEPEQKPQGFVSKLKKFLGM